MMFVELPARSEDRVKPVSINPLHVIAITAAGQDTTEVITTSRTFYVQLPYRDVMRRLEAQALAGETRGGAQAQ